MKTVKLFTLFCAAVLSVSYIGGRTGVCAQAETVSDFDCAYSQGTNTDPFTQYIYGCKEVTSYTQEQAQAAGLPEGYSGTVLSVGEGRYSSAINRGLTLDFSEQKIPTYLVESITFRVYVGDDGNASDQYPEVRIPFPTVNGSWIMRYDVSATTNEWIDIVLKDGNGSFFANGSNVGSFEDVSKDGYLHKFELAMRHNGSKGIFYIDSVKVKLIENDGKAPTLTYEGEDSVTISQGQKLDFDVSAYDELDGEVDVAYVLGDESKLDEQGNPLPGMHTLTFTATDYFGNVAQKSIRVEVIERDVTPPVIEIPTLTVYAKIGAKPIVQLTATDDRTQDVEMQYVWSDGALDARGRLTEGTHTLCVTATDLSENTTQKTITFIVTKQGDSADVIIDEEALCPDIENDTSSGTDSSSGDTESTPDNSFDKDDFVFDDDSSTSDSSSSNSSVEQSQNNEETAGSCFGSVGGAAVAALALAGAAVLKKKEE